MRGVACSTFSLEMAGLQLSISIGLLDSNAQADMPLLHQRLNMCSKLAQVLNICLVRPAPEFQLQV